MFPALNDETITAIAKVYNHLAIKPIKETREGLEAVLPPETKQDIALLRKTAIELQANNSKTGRKEVLVIEWRPEG